ncbi:alpha/beta fold hydrolase [Micromonospora zhanjiangensis]|uniref:Alpha/beta hydrolase family protein n=1 Tax=Micromonospora zhanjiangensis TaxID=1522057 RepID=A0ABV8KK61_9ACTN
MRSVNGRFVGLLVLTAVIPTLETALLNALDFIGAVGFAQQSTAVWPYDSYHDMRWLLVYHNSWLVFGLGFAGAVLVRGLISAVLVRLAWPGEVDCLPFPQLVLRNLMVALLTAVIVSPFAALAVAAAVVSLSWFLFASLLPLLLLSPFLQRASVGRGWWRGLPTAELVGWSVLDFVILTAAGAVIWRVPGYLSVVVAAACGAVNGVLWNRTVRAAVLPSHVHWWRVPVAPLAILMAIVVPLVAQGLTNQPVTGRNNFRPPVLSRPLPPSIPYAVIVLGGHDSAYDGRAAADPAVQEFSYNGLTARGEPLPYSTQTTHRSLESSADLLGDQVNRLHRRTGRPIALLGESEGAMVARTYLDRVRDSPVKALLMFSPLMRTGRAYYPPPEAAKGWGIATGWQLRGIFALVNLISGARDSPDEPFVRSLLDNAPFYRYQVLCPIPGVRVIAFLPTVSAAETPPGPYTNVAVYQVPALHGGLLGRPTVHDKLIEFLAGANVNAPRGEYGILQVLGAAWQAPTLPITVNPVWKPSTGPAFSSGRLCQRR